MLKVSLSLVLTVLCSIGGYSLSAAAEPAPGLSGLTGEQWEQAFDGLDASHLSRETVLVGGGIDRSGNVLRHLHHPSGAEIRDSSSSARLLARPAPVRGQQ
jgi:hypothetical protein